MRGYVNQRHYERDECELHHRMEYDHEYDQPGAVHSIMERELRDHHDIKNKRRALYNAEHGDPGVAQGNQDQQPRSQVVVLERIVHSAPREAAPAKTIGDDLAITAFPVPAPRLRTLDYPENFNPNIKEYDGHSDPNI